MSDIVAFLEARIEEDQINATMRTVHAEGCDWLPDESGYTYPCDCGVPERLLAECASRRAIIELHPRAGDGCCSTCVTDWGQQETEQFPCPTLRAVAAPYASHEDFDPDWRLA